MSTINDFTPQNNHTRQTNSTAMLLHNHKCGRNPNWNSCSYVICENATTNNQCRPTRFTGKSEIEKWTEFRKNDDHTTNIRWHLNARRRQMNEIKWYTMSRNQPTQHKQFLFDPTTTTAAPNNTGGLYMSPNPFQTEILTTDILYHGWWGWECSHEGWDGAPTKRQMRIMPFFFV